MKLKDFIAQFNDPYYKDFEIKLSVSMEANGWPSYKHCDIEVLDIGYSEKVVLLDIIDDTE